MTKSFIVALTTNPTIVINNARIVAVLNGATFEGDANSGKFAGHGLQGQYEVDYSRSTGKTFVSALTGSTLAKIGATMVKAIPGFGSVLGGISMSALAGASTYAVGQVVIRHLEANGDFLNIDLGWTKEAYHEAYEQGKQVVSTLEEETEAAQDVFQALEKLGQLKEKGVITKEEFETQKQKLLDRL